jgi:hypothetical protein
VLRCARMGRVGVGLGTKAIKACLSVCVSVWGCPCELVCELLEVALAVVSCAATAPQRRRAAPGVSVHLPLTLTANNTALGLMRLPRARMCL